MAELADLRRARIQRRGLALADLIRQPGLMRPAHEGVPDAPERARHRDPGKRGPHQEHADADDPEPDDHGQPAAVDVGDDARWDFAQDDRELQRGAGEHELARAEARRSDHVQAVGRIRRGEQQRVDAVHPDVQNRRRPGPGAAVACRPRRAAQGQGACPCRSRRGKLWCSATRNKKGARRCQWPRLLRLTPSCRHPLFSSPCYPARWRRVAPSTGRGRAARNRALQRGGRPTTPLRPRRAGPRHPQRRAGYAPVLLSCGE